MEKIQPIVDFFFLGDNFGPWPSKWYECFMLNLFALRCKRLVHQKRDVKGSTTFNCKFGTLISQDTKSCCWAKNKRNISVVRIVIRFKLKRSNSLTKHQFGSGRCKSEHLVFIGWLHCQASRYILQWGILDGQPISHENNCLNKTYEGKHDPWFL